MSVTDYIKKTWPKTARTPHEGAQWDALAEKVDALVEVYGPDKVINAIRIWCEDKAGTRPTAGQLGALCADLYGADSPFSDTSRCVWCDDDAFGLLGPMVGQLPDDAKRRLMALTLATSGRQVCEWLCQHTPALALIEQTKRGASLDLVDNMIRRVAA